MSHQLYNFTVQVKDNLGVMHIKKVPRYIWGLFYELAIAYPHRASDSVILALLMAFQELPEEQKRAIQKQGYIISLGSREKYVES